METLTGAVEVARPEGVGVAEGPTEVAAKATRRPYTAEYKRRVLQEADAGVHRGDIGALLRREGLYSSLLSTWREQRRHGVLKGLTPKTRGRKAAPVNPLQARLDQVEREKRGVEKKLAKVYAMLEVQKKASEMLGLSLKTLEPDEAD